jgi:hypothetical protein
MENMEENSEKIWNIWKKSELNSEKIGNMGGGGGGFPAILFSLSASYNLIIFYELALSLDICPFPAIFLS